MQNSKSTDAPILSGCYENNGNTKPRPPLTRIDLGLVAWLAVEEIGHPAVEVARFLGISRVGVLLSLEKAKDICQKYEFQLTPPTLQIQYVEK